MRIGLASLPLALLCSCLLLAQTSAHKGQIQVTGKLTRAMAIGGESTGWTLELSPEVTIEDKKYNSFEINYSKTQKLEKLANRTVRVKGMLVTQSGVERGERQVLQVSSIKEVKASPEAKPSY